MIKHTVKNKPVYKNVVQTKNRVFKTKPCLNKNQKQSQARF